MLFQEGHRVEVDGRKGRVVYHSAAESHLVVVRYDDGGIFKVGMHRVRLLEDDGLQLRCDVIHQPVDEDELRARRQTRPAGNVDVVKPEPLEPA